MANESKQGSGKHSHKDSQEPWPHREGGQKQKASSSRQEQRGSSRDDQAGSERESLRSREYRDEQGNVHHHTKDYMERKGDKDRER